MTAFKHILVPIDFGESSRRALDVAIDLAKSSEATLTLFHAFEIPALVYQGMMTAPVDLLTPVQEAAERQFDAELAALRARAPKATGTLVPGVPWQEILRAAKDHNVDLIVIGTHGRRGISRALLGSVAEKVVRLSPVPVLTVRGGPVDDTGDGDPAGTR